MLANSATDSVRVSAIRPRGQIVVEGDMDVATTTQRDDFVYKYQPVRGSYKVRTYVHACVFDERN